MQHTLKVTSEKRNKPHVISVTLNWKSTHRGKSA